MKMNPWVVVIGSMAIFAATFGVSAVMPWLVMSSQPSDIWRARTKLENYGRLVYVQNGCTYCHTQFVRNLDFESLQGRISEEGDYVSDNPHLVGTERTGPDLAQEGGHHPNDSQVAHFVNPRFTSPYSIMPTWAFLGPYDINALIAYVQGLGFKMADFRMKRQEYWKKQAMKAYESGPDGNVKWLHSHVPKGWRTVPNPYYTTRASLARGERFFQYFCIGCHGPVGDGMGPASTYLYPPPLNFTILKGRGISGGILCYQIMNGITGTAMPYFKDYLESHYIWDVGNYVAVYFIGQTDSGKPPKGIEASFEGKGNTAVPKLPPAKLPQEEKKGGGK
ncbi:MAG: cbb3-type cytochrome c oxidase subunit II [Syntrophobacteraceae bacterium]